MICSPEGDLSFEQPDLGPSPELERDFLPSPSQRTGVITVPLQGKCWPCCKTPALQKSTGTTVHPGFRKEKCGRDEAQWVLSPSLPGFDLSEQEGHKQDLGFVFLYFCFPSVNTGGLVLASQLEQESRQISQNISLWSLGYLHQFWLCETARRQFHFSEEKSATLVKSSLFKSSCLQHTSTSFPGLWVCCQLTAQQLNTESWLLFLPLSWAREIKERMESTDNSEECLPVQNILPS